MHLYIIRHGDPDYKNDCLTEKGKQQAQALAQRLALRGIDKVFSSPKGRAKETAEPTCQKLALPCMIEEWASEDLAWRDFHKINADGVAGWSYSCQNTLLKDEKYALSGEWEKLDVFTDCLDVKGGYQRIACASDDFLSRLGYVREKNIYRITKPNEDKVALFCHGGMGLPLLSHLLAIPPLIFFAGFDIPHTGVTVLDFFNYPNGQTAPKCLCFSDLSHLSCFL
jgi:probable phosphoglycerate mutase